MPNYMFILKNRIFPTVIFAATLLIVFPPLSLSAADKITLSKGQTLYVPVYSNVIAGPKEVQIHLSNTLIIRNTDIHNEIQVDVADYYDTKGILIKKFYLQPVSLKPLETKYLYLSDQDREGGVGANFIIHWYSAKEVNIPIVECVMIGSEGRAFVSPAQPIKEDTKQ